MVAAYANWGVVDYRPTRKSKTRAEKMLDEGLPEAQATLLRARMESYPSIYRVNGYDLEAGTVDLEDVLLGGSVRVHDQILCESVENISFVVARIFAAGRFRFLDAAGPPLGAAMGNAAADYLRDCGLEFTPEGLKQGANLFGRLWDWWEDWQDNIGMPVFRNMDGDDILYHIASFVLDDPAAVGKELLRRRDIDYDEENDEYVWTKDSGKAAETIGGRLSMGRIEIVADELVLTTNSARRHEEGRTWLENIPGVTFCDVITRTLHSISENPSADERISPPEPVEITPDMAAGLQEMLEQQYMQWLDKPLPVLNGQTPRQACKTPDGRRQVATLIRTMPDPVGDVPMKVPRQAMLRELGLEAGSGTSSRPAPSGTGPDEPEETNQLHTGPKIGRNDPCPCGSGKKYKKCCGR